MPDPSIFITTDAADKGWGATLGELIDSAEETAQQPKRTLLATRDIDSYRTSHERENADAANNAKKTIVILSLT